MKQRTSLSSIFGPPVVENLESPRNKDEPIASTTTNNNSIRSTATNSSTPSKKTSLMEMFSPPSAYQQEDTFLSPRNTPVKHGRTPSFGRNSASPFHSRRSSGSMSSFHFDFPEEPKQFDDSFHKMVEEKEQVMFYQQQFELHKRQSVRAKKDNLLSELLKKFHSTDKTEETALETTNIVEEEAEELLELEDILEEHFPTKEQVQESLKHSSPLDGLINMKNKRFSLKRNQFSSKKDYLSYLLSRTIDQSLPEPAPGAQVPSTTPQQESLPESSYTYSYVDSCLENEINEFFDSKEEEELRINGPILHSLLHLNNSKNLWVLLEEDKKVECMEYLVNQLECATKEKKMQCLYALLYIALGLFGIENQKDSQMKLIRIHNSLLFSKTMCFSIVIQEISVYMMKSDYQQYVTHLYNLLFLLLICNSQNKASQEEICQILQSKTHLFLQWIDVLFQFYQSPSHLNVKKVLYLLFKWLLIVTNGINDSSISLVKVLEPNSKLKMNPHSHEEALIFATKEYQQEYSNTFDLLDSTNSTTATSGSNTSSMHFDTIEWKQQLQQWITTKKKNKWNKPLKMDPSFVEHPLDPFYKQLHAKMPQFVLVLLQSMLESIPFAFATAVSGGVLFSYQKDWNQREQIMYCSCIVKIASDILLLLLKQLKRIHPMHSMYCNKLLCDANGVVLLLKLLNHPQFDSLNELYKPMIQSTTMRQFHIVITVMRVLQKLTKHNPSSIQILVKQKAYTILKKVAETIPTSLKMFHLYYYKVVKSMCKYLDTKWRKNNGKLITLISMYVRPYLLDDWLFSNGKLDVAKMRELEDAKQDKLDQFYQWYLEQEIIDKEESIIVDKVPSQKELSYFIDEFFKQYY